LEGWRKMALLSSCAVLNFIHFSMVPRGADMASLPEKFDSLFASKRFNVAAFCIIAVMILIAYSNTFKADFHFDDNPSIVENIGIKRFTWESFVGCFAGTRPIINLSIFLNYQLSGLNVVGWHIVNISFHILNSFFVYLLILQTLKLSALVDRYGYRATRMALFGALLFALHPIQTESVTYIISRTELIATFFYLATFLLFIKGTTRKQFAYYIGAFLTATLAMGSKEWSVTLPVMLFLYDFLFLSDSSFKTALTRLNAHFLIAVSWGVLIYTMSTTKMSGAGFGVVGTNNITSWNYLLTSCNVIWTYIRILLLPINQNLDYSYPRAYTLFELPTLLSVLGHLCVMVVAFWLYRKKKWTLIPFGVAWFYITLSPTQSFVPILDMIFEHRVYLPSLGFFVAFIAVFEGVFDWFEKRKETTSGSLAA
jgi:protein O-mannosyl-transferase